ncbi:flagellar FliJ family protein [Desulfosporosinus sp. PR]|uniref:flagellar FliJ family protein n=1 Tax=Candidatus Desulfosporosinus nitrosoreducens TaxID=3401928 RepID=UPI0027F6F9BC|nr:flagellar FliJ family protein [Desulfosporosinus sp. PR]MDQ7096233.1 flagellar FliJ family protein [Desulfosporosinus sp. PR]
MARFQFRLETSLRLAEQALKTARQELSAEIRRWLACKSASEEQRRVLLSAQEEQRNAGRCCPENLGICQVFAQEQQKKLRECEAKQIQQELVLEDARSNLLKAHQEAEKFRRLKEKQLKAFLLAEVRKEQKILDETGQVLYWRKQRLL